MTSMGCLFSVKMKQLRTNVTKGGAKLLMVKLKIPPF